MSEILILGAGGFIGINLIKKIALDSKNHIVAADKNEDQLALIRSFGLYNVETKVVDFGSIDKNCDLLRDKDLVFHLVSTTVPTTSNMNISREIKENVVYTSILLDICVKMNVGRVIFLSSGGTVYGKDNLCPLNEEMKLKPINSYGMQKMAIESLLYVYKYQFGLDYKVIRLSNPYGPYQKTDGVQGVISTFIYNAIKNDDIVIYGDGSVVRDYIYIDDAIDAIINVAFSGDEYHTYNVASGKGITVNEVVENIKRVIDTSSMIKNSDSRKVDVPINYLDISRYESVFGNMRLHSLQTGIRKTMQFFVENHYYG